jgi:hypothetical protein
MLEIEKQNFGFKTKEIWFCDHPFDVNGYHMVTFINCKNKIESKGFEEEEFTTLVIDLTQELDEIWKNIVPSIRNAINHARRLGVKIKVNDNYEEFCEINRSFRKDKGLSGDYIEIDFMKKHGPLFVAEHNGEIITGQFYLQDENNICAVLAASKRLNVDKEKATLIGKANKLITWEAINYAKSKGIKEFDMGGFYTGSLKNEQKEKINTFKKRFGGKLVTYYKHHKYYSRIFKYKTKLYPLKLRLKSYLCRRKNASTQ